MKLNYLWTNYYYKPEYDLEDFVRVNELGWMRESTVVKIMVKLYALYMDENYPWNINPTISFYSLYYIKMEENKPRLVKFVDEINFDELEDWQMFSMVDWKLAIINPTEEDRRDYYYDQKAEFDLEEYYLSQYDEN